MLFTLLTVVHVIVCLFLIGVVLLQSGKAADLAGAFGGMGSQTAFGPRGAATLLSKLTTGSAIVFMVTSLTLSIVATRTDRGGKSVLENAKAPVASQPKPVTQVPAPTAPGGAPPTVEFKDLGTGKSTGPLPLNLPPNPAQQKAPAQQQQAPAKK